MRLVLGSILPRVVCRWHIFHSKYSLSELAMQMAIFIFQIANLCAT